MIADNFTVESVDWSNERERSACRAVRDEVFVIEQNVPVDEEIDEFDAVSAHVLARDLDRNPIATGRLVPPRAGEPPRIGRMAVLKTWRGQHVGEALMHALLDRARALGYPTLEMHAQSHAIAFYERFGFSAYGDEFFECDIAHKHMRTALEPLASAPHRSAASDIHPAASTQSVVTTSRDEAFAATLDIIGAARREACIYSRSLDPTLLDTEAALDALKQLAISGRGANIRILILDPLAVAQRGHRLIGLAQRLSSIFAVRVPTAEDRLYASAFVLNDNHGYYFRTFGDRYEGEVCTRGPGRHAQLQAYFDQVWERAEPGEDLRALSL